MLCVQYDSWLCNYGKGRDENDLRFGQWVHCNFDLKVGTDRLITMQDGFYAEDPEIAFEQISAILDK